MKKFLYLRMVAIANLVVIVCCFVLILRRVIAYWYIGNLHIAGAAIITACALPGLLVLFIYTRYYPNKELPKKVVLGYRVGEVIAWIGTVAVLLSVFLFEDLGSPLGSMLCTLIFIFTLILLIKGGKLLKTIHHNARLILENSFS